MYKLVAIDMDGTLLTSTKQITDRTKAAVNAAKAKGAKIVVCTGRPMEGVKRFLKELNLVEEGDYAIAFNGSLVQDTYSGKVISEIGVSIEDLDYLYDLSLKLKVNIHALLPHSCITPVDSKYSRHEAEINDIPLEIVDFNTLDRNAELVKIMFIDEAPILDRVIAQLPEDIYERFTIVRSAPFFLEFLNKSVDKGVGVSKLAETLGIKQEEVICIGDADNDRHMLEYAGLAVAMGNAFPHLKEIADYVTFTNDEDGVAHIIEKFILEQ